ncbi:MAG: hypothetical protein V2A61_05475 [Calditrichota bacterium]
MDRCELSIKNLEFKTLVGVGSLYLALWLFLPVPAIWGVDNGFKWLGITSFTESGRIQVLYAGAQFDTAGKYRPLLKPFGVMWEGSQIPTFSPLFMIGAGGLKRLLGDRGSQLFPLLGALAALFSLWGLQRKLNPRDRGGIALKPGLQASRGTQILTLIAAGLGTPLLFYGLTLWEHSWAAALTLLSMLLVTSDANVNVNVNVNVKLPASASLRTRLQLVGAGFSSALAAGMRTEAVLFIPLTAVLWRLTRRPWRELWFYSGGSLGGLVLVGALNYYQTGVLLPLHLITNWELAESTGGLDSIAIRIHNLYKLIAEGFAHVQGSLLGLCPFVILLAWRGWRHRWAGSFILTGLILTVGFSYLYFSLSNPHRAAYLALSGGMVWITPLILLGLIFPRSQSPEPKAQSPESKAQSLKGGHGDPPHYRFIWWISLLYIILVILSLPTVHYGVHWGPRFLLPAILPLILIATERLQRWWKRYSSSRSVLAALIVLSVLCQVNSLTVLFPQVRANHHFQKWVKDDNLPVVTNCWWFAGDAAEAARQVPWFLVGRYEDLANVLNELSARNINEVCFLENREYVPDAVWRGLGWTVKRDDYFPEAGISQKGIRKRVLLNNAGSKP